MAYSPRTDAEIRRMACHKAAAELFRHIDVKDQDSGNLASLEQVFASFLKIVELLDADVLDAGEKWMRKVQAEEQQFKDNVENGKPQEDIDKKLNPAQQEKLLQLLKARVPENDKHLKLKLWSMQVPLVPHEELVTTLTLEQGMTLVTWINEQAESTPDNAA